LGKDKREDAQPQAEEKRLRVVWLLHLFFKTGTWFEASAEMAL
jgi:hypothetical protein